MPDPRLPAGLTPRPSRLLRLFRRMALPAVPACAWDIEHRLYLDACGPVIHIDYYRKDADDALDEIRRLRKVVEFLETARG